MQIKTVKAPMTFIIEAFGGDNRDRTGDLLNAIQALSQLSYTPTGLDYNTRLISSCQPQNFKGAENCTLIFLLQEAVDDLFLRFCFGQTQSHQLD